MTRDEIVSKSRAEGGMFIVIPSVVALDEALPLSAQMLYGIITWKCNSRAFTWATNRALGEALGVSAKRVSVLLSLLEERGHIETEIEYKEGTKEILRRYIYPIMKSSKGVFKHDPPLENEDTPPPENEDTLPPGTGIPIPENEEVKCNNKYNNKLITPYSPPEGDGAPPADASPEDKPARKPRRTRRDKSAPDHDPEAFEVFWTNYPRKDDRKAAIRAWDKLKPDKPLCRTMYTALKRQRGSEQWAEAGGKYIPLFSTWLNGRKWENQGVDLSLLQGAQGSGGCAPGPERSGSSWADAPD